MINLHAFNEIIIHAKCNINVHILLMILLDTRKLNKYTITVLIIKCIYLKYIIPRSFIWMVRGGV